ncbi:MAG: hypothetical protein RMI85_01510 [Candidatus Korarchaeum sp.]|nr:hypothetical protein [Candidatus Korarchaeum sp.]
MVWRWEERFFVKPIEVIMTPDGEVEVKGEGEFSIRAHRVTYKGTKVRLDTGFLPEYTSCRGLELWESRR